MFNIREELILAVELQWVHGPQTVVMLSVCKSKTRSTRLQWVHGPQTVVMSNRRITIENTVTASMGPRSSDRGYALISLSI